MNLREIRIWFVHLRLNFQFCLSPIFLWGALLAGGRVNATLVLGYIALHLFGYGGVTAYNSYYDRDTGPIGGLEHPPPVSRGLLWFSLVWQFVGLLFALATSVPAFILIYLAMLILSVAYSHPRIRWKGNALASLATVALGQGVLGFWGGWACARGELQSALTPAGVFGAIAVTLITVGFYPLTGIYQIEEDRQRGDQTLPVWLGPATAFRFALFCLTLGGATAIALVVLLYHPLEALVLAAFLGAILTAVWRWSLSFDPANVLLNFHTIMRLYATTSVAFTGWIALHLVGIL